MPQWLYKRRSSIARKAPVTYLGSFFASTGASTIAPVRAIGVPSEASKVICGGAIGSSDFDSGAVSASQPTSRSEEHTSELRSLMRNSSAVFCLKQKKLEEHGCKTGRAHVGTPVNKTHDGSD